MGQRIYNFNQYNEYLIRESQNAQAAILAGLNKRVWSEIFTSSYLSEEEKTWFSNFLTESNIAVDLDNINEALWDTIKSGIEKVVDSGKNVGKAIGDKLGKAIDGAKAFANYVGDLIKKSWDKLIEFFKKKFSGVKDIIKKDYETAIKGVDNAKEKLNDELWYLNKTIEYWTVEVPKMLIDAIKGKFANEIVKECLTNNGDILNELSVFNPSKMDILITRALNEADDVTDEGSDKDMFSFLSGMAHAVSKWFPFNLLHKIKSLAEKGTKLALKKLSELTDSLKGPGVYDFELISLIAAGAFEYWVKGKMTAPLKDILTAEPIMRVIPMGTTIITAIEWVALTILIIEIIEELSGNETQNKPQH